MPVSRSSCSRSTEGALTIIGFERLHGLAPGLDRGVASHFEVADHLDRARAGLRQRSGLASQDAAGGALGVERIVLTFLVPQLAIGAVDLEHGMTVLAQEAGQASAVGAGALDTKGADRPQGLGPGLQGLVAFAAGRDGQIAEAGAECTDRHGSMGELMGIDTDDDVGIRKQSCSWCGAPSQTEGLAIERADRTVMGHWTPSSPYEVTIRSTDRCSLEGPTHHSHDTRSVARRVRSLQTAPVYSQLHGSVGRAHSPLPRSGSCDADGLRASQLQHAVQRMDGNVHLGRPTLVRAASAARHRSPV